MTEYSILSNLHTQQVWLHPRSACRIPASDQYLLPAPALRQSRAGAAATVDRRDRRTDGHATVTQTLLRIVCGQRQKPAGSYVSLSQATRGYRAIVTAETEKQLTALKETERHRQMLTKRSTDQATGAVNPETNAIGKESVPKIVINDTVNLFFLNSNRRFANFKP